MIRYSSSQAPRVCLRSASRRTLSRSSGRIASIHLRGDEYRDSRVSHYTFSYPELIKSILFFSNSVIQKTSSMFSTTWRNRSSLSRSDC